MSQSALNSYARVLRSCIVCALLVCGTNARQIRINRHEIQVVEDNDNDNDVSAEQAVVKEVTTAPYPAAGYRPSRAFPLPNEGVVEQLDATTTIAALTDTEAPDAFTTSMTSTTTATTNANEIDSTTPYNAVRAEVNDAAMGRSRAPYPAAGYRPSRAFLLPTEVGSDTVAAAAINQPLTNANDMPGRGKGAGAGKGNANHPACGSNDNPVAPKPPANAVDDPDAERVLVTTALGPGVVSSSVPRAASLLATPRHIIVGAVQPFVW